MDKKNVHWWFHKILQKGVVDIKIQVFSLQKIFKIYQIY